ncbi:MAG: hypothetical protein Q8R28_01755 [Dehalococcoidia bacterium]|nr:hypothetical protein [Dehalococcoidia bacterium]
MRRTLSALLMILAISPILFLFGQPGTALAHERHKVGKYELEAGFLNEPAFVGQMNPMILEVTNTETNKPVEGLQQTLDAEITSGGKTMTVSLRPVRDDPGLYLADIIPTRVGAYAVRFFGEIEGMKINESFRSGPGTFSDVEGTEKLQFPDKAPEVSEMGTRLQGAEAAAQDARNTATLLGVAALALGAVSIALVVSLALGVVSIRVRRS